MISVSRSAAQCAENRIRAAFGDPTLQVIEVMVDSGKWKIVEDDQS